MLRLLFILQIAIISFWANFYSKSKIENKNITLCMTSFDNMYKNLNTKLSNPNTPFRLDTTKAYSMPLLSNTNGKILLSWTEKDPQGITSFCLAFSTDNGSTFSNKKVIFSGNGVSNSRMMRAKVLAKKDGSLFAVFSNRADAAAGGRGRAADLVYCVSKDNGSNWTSPKSVDADPTTCMRGFFDAVLMANDEVAIAYLKDVANSTKHEERNLRLVTTKNGSFLPERIIDPVVCDCCPIGLLVDKIGALNVYYRDNNDDIRDMAMMTSTDNGLTFTSPKIVYDDQWKIQGCPHSGPIASTDGKNKLISWYSGSDKEPGLRLANSNGQKLFVINDASAKNAALVELPKNSVMLWEQNNTETKATGIAMKKIENNQKASETTWIDGSANATNVSSIAVGNQLLVVYEVKQSNKRNTLAITKAW